jgi:hypothetical protein
VAAESIRRDVYELFRLADIVDRLYDATHGEETEDTAALDEFLAQDSARVLEALAEYVLDCQSKQEATRAEIARLNDRAATLAKREGWAREQIGDVLHRLGVRKAEAGTKTVSLRAGAQRVVDDGSADPSLLPEALTRTIPERIEPDKRAIAVALKNGEQVFGYRLERGAETVSVR